MTMTCCDASLGSEGLTSNGKYCRRKLYGAGRIQILGSCQIGTSSDLLTSKDWCLKRSALGLTHD